MSDTPGYSNHRVDHSAIWTGSKMIIWGGGWLNYFTNDGYSYDPQNDHWDLIGNGGVFPGLIGRASHSAIWTGNSMVIWGGINSTKSLASGYRYEPDTGIWTNLSQVNAPSPRHSHSAIWTGSEMIIFGGLGGTSADPLPTDAAKYDPLLDTWRPISMVGAPSPRGNHLAFWNGSKMIIWGGYNGVGSLNSGGIYDPTTDTWSPMTNAGAPADYARPIGVWTGSDLLVWNGIGAGGRFSIKSGKWNALSTVGAPTPRNGHQAVFAQGEMVIWGGLNSSGNPTTDPGARYNPITDVWTTMSSQNSPTPRAYHSILWTGEWLLVWGGMMKSGVLKNGKRYSF
jgi:N-acetylneuraminic acid mutarotase